ncbi:hypothetical protein [Streptomyces cinerochromogenes]|uniref:hypothetical protein n=1 Tax=Streptomyces cinerochromogenes TaxID=66422 RepID=UPI0033BE3160
MNTLPAAAPTEGTRPTPLLRLPGRSGTALGMAGRLVGTVPGPRTFSRPGLFVVGGALADRYGVRPAVLTGCAPCPTWDCHRRCWCCRERGGLAGEGAEVRVSVERGGGTVTA